MKTNKKKAVEKPLSPELLSKIDANATIGFLAAETAAQETCRIACKQR